MADPVSFSDQNINLINLINLKNLVNNFVH